MSASPARLGLLQAAREGGPRRPGMLRIELMARASAGLCAVGGLLVAIGYLPGFEVLVVSGYCTAGNLAFYLLQCSGRSARFKDPACIFSSHLFTISALLFGCMLIPQDRGPALQLFLLIWAFDLPRLSRRQQSVAALVALVGIFVIEATSWLASGDIAALHHDLTSLGVAVVYLPILIAVGHTVRRIRARHTQQQAALAGALTSLRTLSERDALTGASNRRHAQEVLVRETARQSRTGRPFSVCLLDLDLFKRINDIHGHATGDAVLIGTARLLRELLPEPFTVARWGGEEFLVLMPETTSRLAAAWMRQARACIGARDWLDCSAALRVDFSVGVCEHREGASTQTTLERADRALYQAKELGRGRVVEQPE